MKNHKRILSLALSLVMLLSLVCIPAAAEKSQVKQYGKTGGVLVLGDSFAAGIGSENWLDEVENVQQVYGTDWKRWVTGAFPALVADAVGCEAPGNMNTTDGNFWPCSVPGQTLAATMDLLGIDDGFVDTEYYHNPDIQLMHNYYQKSLKYFGDTEKSYAEGYVLEQDGLTGSAVDRVQDASLIIVELGMNDIFSRAFLGTFYDSIFSEETSVGESINAAAVAKLGSTIAESYAYWKNAYPKLIQSLKNMNENATIVMVGFANLTYNITLNDESVTPLGTVIAPFILAANNQMKEWASEYNTIFVDISNVEMGAAQNDMTLADLMQNFVVMTHPTPEGHAQIARLILNSLPREGDVENDSRLTDIVVDLGRYDSVDFVAVNGHYVTNYTIENNVLTVPSLVTTARRLMIGVVRDGKLQIVYYHLDFDEDGYSASRVYSSNDTFGSVSKLFARVTMVMQRVISAVRK